MLDVRKNRKWQQLGIELAGTEPQEVQIAIADSRTPEQWTTVFEGQLLPGKGQRVALNQKVSGRYIRFSAKGKALAIAELREKFKGNTF